VPRSPLNSAQMPAKANSGRSSLSVNQTTSVFLVTGSSPARTPRSCGPGPSTGSLPSASPASVRQTHAAVSANRSSASEPDNHFVVIRLWREGRPISANGKHPELSGWGPSCSCLQPCCSATEAATAMMYKRWTTADDELIKAFVARGASIVRAASALKRKQAAVRIRARKLGYPFPTINAARKKRAASADSLWRLY
jgi:hypothetical protein